MISNENNLINQSIFLFGLNDKLDFLIRLNDFQKLPKILMITGEKGIGKFTLISHLLYYIFNKNDYDLKKKRINNQTRFYKQFLSNTFPNIIYLSGQKFGSVKIDSIRDLKLTLSQTTISENKRFIILDDVELFNKNTLNALLKIIEEPTSNNYFILINNKTKPLIETIYSRSLEIKLILNDVTKKNIIKLLIQNNNIKSFLDYESFSLTPGNFLKFNKICEEYNIDIKGNFLENLKILLNLYKKSKDIDFINFILFLTDLYFNDLSKNKSINIEIIDKNRMFVLSNIDSFIKYNLNQTSLINAINNKLSYE